MSYGKASRGVRSLPHRRPYVVSICFALLHFLSIVAAGTLGYILIRSGDLRLAKPLIASVVAIGVTWLLSYASRRSARCPLCAGTPLLDTAAVKHRKAVRFKPLNYGMSAQLQLCCLHSFCCMYCGTPYDLMRKPTHLRQADQSH